jgi:hypothetical protein
MPQKDFNTSVMWLQARAQSLQREILSEIDDLLDPQQKQLLEKMMQFHELALEIQALVTLDVLAHVRENNTSVDRELGEICDYMEQILFIHRREHDNLQKIL